MVVCGANVFCITSRNAIFEFVEAEGGWKQSLMAGIQPVVDITLLPDTSLFAVGRSGEVFQKKSNSNTWTVLKKTTLLRVTAGSPDNVWGIDEDQKIYRFNGSGFSKIQTKKHFVRITANTNTVLFY